MEHTETTNRGGAAAERAHTVLLGDDDEGLRHLLAEVLHNEGFEVIEAANRREAVEIFEQQHARINLVLLDMSHARPTAGDALSRLRATSAAAKVLLLTGNSRLDAVEETLAQGFNAFIPKPFTVMELLEPLRRLLGADESAALAT